MELLCKSLLGEKIFETPATIHGNVWEATGVKAYQEKTGKVATGCGLIIHPLWPFLGASPDGLVDDDILLEVKCPFSGRDSQIKPGKFFPFLQQDVGGVVLKKTHKYYYQIIGQLTLSHCKICHFVVFTHVNLLVLEIPHSPQFFEEKMLPYLETFYVNHYCLYVASKL